MKILIIRLSSIGDCVLSSPVLEALRERYPKAHIAWAVQSKSVAVVRGLPGLDQVILWDKKSRDEGFRAAVTTTWRGKFDVALDLQGLDKATLFALASRARRRISGTSARFMARHTSNEKLVENEMLHARLFALRRASPLDIAPDAAARFFPRVPLTDAHRESARDWLRAQNIEDDAKIMGLNLGASDAEKQWPPERFAQLASALLEDDRSARVVAFGAPADQELWQCFNDEWQRLTANRAAMESRVANAVGKLSLLEVAAVAEKSAVFVSADTGPMHIAAAVGAPLVALFGPTDVARTGPVQNPNGAPIRVLDARALTGSSPAPMSALEVDAVLEAAQLSIAQAASPTAS